MAGLFFAQNPDGSYRKIGEAEEIHATIPAEDLGLDVRGPRFTEAGDGTFNGYVEFDFTPNKNVKKLWGKLLGIPKSMVTEWCFPRKKKRGSRRRNRKFRKELENWYAKQIREEERNE